MPNTILDTVRDPLKTALSTVTANVYSSVPEDPYVPFCVFVPDSPYLQIEMINKSTLHMSVSMVISCGVAYNDNAAALDNLEKLIISVLKVIPAGYTIGAIEKPSVMQIGASNKLVADISVSTYYTQN